MTLLDEALSTGTIEAELVLPGVPTPTVTAAAQALGVSEAQILKSVLFVDGEGQAVLAVARGTARVDEKLLARVVGLGRLKLAPPNVVLSRTGYPAGGAAPVCHATPLSVVVDTSVLEHEVAYAGGGRVDALLRIAPAEIVRATGAVVADITR